MANGGAKGVMTAQANNGKPGMGRVDPASLYSDPNLGNSDSVGGQQGPPSLYSDPNLGQPRLLKGMTPITGGPLPIGPGWRGPQPGQTQPPLTNTPPPPTPLPPPPRTPLPPPPPTPTPQRAPNINQTAASGINDSIGGARREMGFQPGTVGANGYRARFSQGQGYNASGAAGRGYQAAGTSGQGFDAAGVNSQGYGAERVADRPGISANSVTAGQVGNTDLSRYMNQYDTQVIDNTLSDLDRSRQLQQQNIGANASAAGAYGGARHALRESENNRNYFDQAAQTSSALRQAGFNNAQQMGLTDIQNTMQGDLANQGANLQAGTLNANLGQQRAMANQMAGNQASQFGATAGNQAAQQASAQQQAANQFGAQAGNTSGLANQASLNQARQFGSQAANTANLANQSAFNNAGQFGAQARNTSGLANQSAYNNSGQFNAGARQAAQMANQNAGLSGSQQRLAAGNQLGNLANLGFGMGQTLSGNLAQDGAMKQGINQLLIDAAKNQYGQYTNAPYQSIGLLSQALGASPVPQTTTTSKQPGLFDYLTLGAGMM